VPPIRAVLPLATRGAVLRETARLPQAATVMSPATTSAHAVMTLQQVAAAVRTQQNNAFAFVFCVCTIVNLA